MFEKTKRAFTTEQLQSYLREKLTGYYSAGVPDFVQERLEEELHCMQAAHAEEKMLLCHTLGKTAARSGHILHVDGGSVGSLLVFLLIDSKINPLPAHYYCRCCGYSETAPGIKFGLDLPGKTCPYCGAEMAREGFGIPVETVWRSNGRKAIPLEYRCSEGFFPYAYRAIKAFYAERNREVVPQGAIRTDESSLLEPIGAVVLPENCAVEAYPRFQAYLSDGTFCFVGERYEMERQNMDKIILLSGNIPTALQRMQAAAGKFWADFLPERAIGMTSRDVVNTAFVSEEERRALRIKNASYYEIACALTIPHNTYTDEGEPIYAPEVLHIKEFAACPICCREDVFDKMIEAGAVRSRAAEVSERIAWGEAARDPKGTNLADVPKALLEVSGYCAYLFPRGSGAQRLISLMSLAKDLEEDPRRYFKALEPMFQKR